MVSILALSEDFAGRRPRLTVSGLADDLYRAILGREADPGGRDATCDAIRRGRLADRVADMVLSPEYTDNRGALAQPLVHRLVDHTHPPPPRR